MSPNSNNKKFFIKGLLTSLTLLILYFVILSIANSFSHAVEQFSQMWYWILILVAGFGLQVGLYTFIREKLKTAPTKVLATSGGISTGSMIACCLHHLVDVLPIIGLAAISLFLIKYQILFIIIGILSNLIGITVMLEIIQKNNLADGFLKKILIYDMNRVKKVVAGFSLVLFLITFVSIGTFSKKEVELAELKPDVSPQEINLPSQTNNQNGISFEVSPLDFSFENPVKFEVKIDSHSGSLDFNLVKISFLEDNKGNKYQPLEWQGSPSGGHHRSGILIFPSLNNQIKKIKLVIQDISNFSPRVFEWSLE